MDMPERYVYLRFQIDTNRINTRQQLDNMNQLESWAQYGVIELQMSQCALQEARQGSNSKRSKKAIGHIFSITYASTPEEQDKLKAIESIIFPDGAKNNNQKNDVEIVFNSAKYGYMLVTNDGGSKSQPGGILGNANRLKNELGIDVISDTEAVQLVKRKIRDRDVLCRIISAKNNQAIPDWVGNDLCLQTNC